jgi:hypothetical protein
MAKLSKNLSLDPEAVRRGERFSELHQTSIAQLVNNFLSNLPVESEEHDRTLSPAVRRLLGIGSGPTDVVDYHRHLAEKYGR